MPQAMSQGQPYQGYPYVNPVVIDAPSLSPAQVASLARWQNLPRRPARKYEGGSSQEFVVSDAAPAQPSLSSLKEDYDTPVVYIEIPESNGSEVSQIRPDEAEPAYVQETIFYDQFKDKRIEVSSPEGSYDGPGPSASASFSRPPPPSSLGFNSPGSSGPSNFSPTLPPFMTKESYVYGRQPTPDDGFPLSPLPVTDFPGLPPPYEEVETRPKPQTTVEADPPRTQVIVPDASQTVILDGRRKLVTCPYCRSTVQTIVIRENGMWTHIIACIFFIIFLPMVILVYCFDCFKHKYHYCPRCNKKIAQEPPSLCGSYTTYS